MSFSPSNFGRYVSQTEQSTDEVNGINEWTQPTPSASTINDIPSFLPTSTTQSPPIITTNISQKIMIPPPPLAIKDDVEPLPFPQHGPGPIQRPNKLTCPPTQPTIPSYLTNSMQPPGTPDVLDQLNRLLDQNNTTAVPPTPNVNNSSMPLNDLSTPTMPWATFSSTEWPTKYDSPWSLGTLQSPTGSLTTQVQNPFAMMATINDQQRQQPTREEASVWPPVLGSTPPRLIPSSIRTQRASAWNEIFQSTVPSSTESPRPTNSPWLRYFYVPDPSSADVTTSNGHDAATNNPFWNLGTLSNEQVMPPTISNQQQATPTAWWPNSSSDENNNTNQSNHLTDDTTTNRDRSRWEFAR